jgi:hypothetical protein
MTLLCLGILPYLPVVDIGLNFLMKPGGLDLDFPVFSIYYPSIVKQMILWPSLWGPS